MIMNAFVQFKLLTKKGEKGEKPAAISISSIKGELGGTGCCGGSNSSVTMTASARHLGFESLSCQFFFYFFFFMNRLNRTRAFIIM